ncbi:hypothetical protein [Nonomuraea typhae]|uniref:hypothetical protein n=1 Tax=Nonomuraea typhae TaxID=2603600 RepID=UPI0012F7F0B2|nr:hypothetical protein [Nonomuraea typhae]
MGTTNTRKTGKPGQSGADWSLAPRGPVSATAQGALALAAAAVVGDVAALPPWWGAAATAAGVVSTVLVSSRRNWGPAALLYRLGCWLGAGAWWTYTLFDTVWTQAAWGALAIGAVAAGLLSPLGKPIPNRRLRSATAPPRGAAGLISRKASLIGQDWEARIMRVCRMRVQVHNVVPWVTGAGYDVHLELPGGGTTRQQLANYAEALATDACLPEGCSVEVAAAPGGHRGMVVLRVSTVNRMAQAITYPATFTVQSILGDLTLGEYPNSDPTTIHIRQESVLIVGKKGSGKTTLLQDVSMELGRCGDTLVWHIDLGGGITQPWIDVWLDGKVERCPIDWAATDRDEVVLMLDAALHIAKHRKTAYRKLKRAHNTNLLPVSAELPEIAIVLDEGAESFKDPQVAKLLGEVQNIGREPAINLVVSALRPTSDLVPVNMRKQSGVRILMHGPDDDEIGHMFTKWGQGLSMDALAGPGTAFISIGGSHPRPFRAHNNHPAMIEAAAIAVAGIRPDLDDASADAAGYWYETRYERMRQTFTATADDLDEESTGPAPARPGAAVAVPAHPGRPAPMPAPKPYPAPYSAPGAGQGGRHLVSVPEGASATDWPDLMNPIPAPPVRQPTGSATDWPDLMNPIPQQPGAGPQAGAGQARPLPEIMRRVLEVFTHARANRIHSEALAAALGIVDGTGNGDPVALAALLRPLGVTPLKRAFRVSGTEARGYALVNVRAVAEGIACGEIAVPAEVAEWSVA